VNNTIIIRNSEIGMDARLKRAANLLIKNGNEVMALGWLRTKADLLKKKNDNTGFHIDYFFQEAPFGRGMKNAWQIVKFNFWIFSKLRRYESKFDIIHACDLDTVIVSFLAARIYRKKIVFDIVDNYGHTHSMPRILKKIVNRIEKRMISLVDGVIVCNDERYMETLCSRPKNCLVLHNSPDFEESLIAQRFLKKPTDKFKIAYIGTLVNEGRLLREIVEASKSHSEIELHVAGIGPLGEFVRMIQDSSTNVFFYGQLANEDALRLQNECDLLFATYDPKIRINKLSAPLKLYEAMALKKPIIVCRGTTADKIVEKNNMGKVIGYDAIQFWEIASELSSNRNYCEMMGKNGNEAYKKVYSWELMKSKLMSFYNEI